MEILNVIQCANLGGMEQSSLRLMRSMQALGVQSQLLSLHPVGNLAPLLDDAGIAHAGLRYRGPAGMGIIGDLARELQHRRVDRVVMTGPHLAALLAFRLAKLRGSFMAVHFHHTGVKSNAAWRWIYRMALDRFDWITFPCDFVRDEAVRILPRLEGRSKVLRNPQEPASLIADEERRQARVRLGIPEDAFVVGNAGWLIPRKRFDVFLRVATEVAKNEPRALFLIAGGGEDEGCLKSLAEELGIADKVRWLGWLKQLDEFYRTLDVLLFNTDWDALPMTPQEAVTKAIPLVASVANGGLVEILAPATAERLLDCHDIDTLAAQVLRIRDHPEQAREEALAGREHLQGLTNPAMIAKEHLTLLEASA